MEAGLVHNDTWATRNVTSTTNGHLSSPLAGADLGLGPLPIGPAEPR